MSRSPLLLLFECGLEAEAGHFEPADESIRSNFAEFYEIWLSCLFGYLKISYLSSSSWEFLFRWSPLMSNILTFTDILVFPSFA